MTALVRLVEIGRLRDGRPCYLPLPELQLVGAAVWPEAVAAQRRLERMTGIRCEGEPERVATLLVRETLDSLVADRQRIVDALGVG